jgi:hypothetical protein
MKTTILYFLSKVLCSVKITALQCSADLAEIGISRQRGIKINKRSKSYSSKALELINRIRMTSWACPAKMLKK